MPTTAMFWQLGAALSQCPGTLVCASHQLSGKWTVPVLPQLLYMPDFVLWLKYRWLCLEVQKEAFKSAFQQWYHPWQKCVTVEVVYFECRAQYKSPLHKVKKNTAFLGTFWLYNIDVLILGKEKGCKTMFQEEEKVKQIIVTLPLYILCISHEIVTPDTT
jgi:hypothetical protein